MQRMADEPLKGWDPIDSLILICSRTLSAQHARRDSNILGLVQDSKALFEKFVKEEKKEFHWRPDGVHQPWSKMVEQRRQD